MNSPLPPNASGFGATWLADLRAWCRGRSWFIRVPVWVYLAYVCVEQFYSPATYFSLFAGINLGIHEGGHLLFRSAGEFMHIAGGTIAQLAAPIISMSILWQQRDYFGISFCLGWLSTNLIGVGVYMADARDMDLPLVTVEGGGSDNPEIAHDWHYLFGQLGLLDHDKTIGLFTRGFGSVTMIFTLGMGAWIIWEIYSSNRNAWPKSRAG